LYHSLTGLLRFFIFTCPTSVSPTGRSYPLISIKIIRGTRSSVVFPLFLYHYYAPSLFFPTRFKIDGRGGEALARLRARSQGHPLFFSYCPPALRHSSVACFSSDSWTLFPFESDTPYSTPTRIPFIRVTVSSGSPHLVCTFVSPPLLFENLLIAKLCRDLLHFLLFDLAVFSSSNLLGIIWHTCSLYFILTLFPPPRPPIFLGLSWD